MILSRPDLIDSALLRPGRLDKSLLCNIPDAMERKDVSGGLQLKPPINHLMCLYTDS